MKFFKRNKGITLVALVVTIVIMLILAGVTLNIALGENGLFKMATKSVDKYKEASEEEQRQTARFNAIMNKETYKYTAKDGKTVSIPAGFAPTQIEGEDSVNDGLVITDSEGNEFVWIPVKEESNYEQADNLPTSETDKWKSSDRFKNTNNLANPHEQMNIAKESVKIYKGFYVARYEAGVPTNADFYVDKNSKDKTYAERDEQKEEKKLLLDKRNVITNKNNVNLKPVSKKGNQVWNCINQKNAVTLSKNMYSESSSVNSYLIDSNAWNYICQYIFDDKVDISDFSKYGNYYDNTETNYEEIIGLFALHTFDKESKKETYAKEYKYGNVPSNYPPRDEGNNLLELATGICDDFKLYNIYDMGGNVSEWTAMTGSGSDELSRAVLRGGNFFDGGSEGPVSFSDCQLARDGYLQVGFRVVLYLK